MRKQDTRTTGHIAGEFAVYTTMSIENELERMIFTVDTNSGHFEDKRGDAHTNPNYNSKGNFQQTITASRAIDEMLANEKSSKDLNIQIEVFAVPQDRNAAMRANELIDIKNDNPVLQFGNELLKRGHKRISGLGKTKVKY